MRIIGKRGDEKYYILISLILGVMVLALSLYFIYHEYFTEDDLNWEQCRESILLRANLPETELFKVIDVSSKDFLPLKCQTQVINIDYEDVDKIEEKIAETMAGCWYLVGEGYYKFFASDSSDIDTRCLVCARIHLDSEVEEYYKNNLINFRDALATPMSGTKNYWDYLNNKGIQAIPMYFGGSNFWSKDNKFHAFAEGHEFAVTDALSPVSGIISFARWMEAASDEEGFGYKFPKTWDVSRGDFFVVISNPARKEIEISPFLLFLQEDDLGELDKSMASFGGINWGKLLSLKPWEGFDKVEFVTCKSYETVPA